LLAAVSFLENAVLQGQFLYFLHIFFALNISRNEDSSLFKRANLSLIVTPLPSFALNDSRNEASEDVTEFLFLDCEGRGARRE